MFLSKNKSNSKAPEFSKKPTIVPSTKKLTPAQSERLPKILAKMPPIEKIDPAMYAKLQSTVHDTVEKALPEYQRWVNSSLTAANDCPTPLCSSCGNDCPTPLCSSCGNDCPTPTANRNIEDKITSAVEKAMTAAIRQALKEQFK